MFKNLLFSICIVNIFGMVLLPAECLGGPTATGTEGFLTHDVFDVAGTVDEGRLAPDFVLSDLEGRSITLSELRGRDVLLVFMSVGCPYCSAKIPLLNEADRGGLKVIGVVLGATTPQMREYINDLGVEFDILPDPDGVVGGTYGIHSVPAPFWIDPDGAIVLGGIEDAPEIWSSLSRQKIKALPSSDLQAYLVPYVGDIDGGIDSDWFNFYEDYLLKWHDDNSMPGSFSFYPDTMDYRERLRFNQIIAAMHESPNVELVLKGEYEYEGKPLPLMTYWEVKEALRAWQCKFVTELEMLGLSDIKLPIAYNQLYMEFTPIMRDAAHDVGFKMFFDQGTGGFEHVSPLPDFDITQYSVPLTTSGMPGPEEVFKNVNQVIQEVLDYEDDWMLYIDGIKVVPLMCHQQDFRISEESSVVDEDKWGIYTELLTTANADPRIQLLRPEQVYDLRHKDQFLRDYILSDFEADDHGWTASGRFEIGVPKPIDPDEGECVTDCFGTGPSSDHSAVGVNAACTNLDGYLQPGEFSITNTLLSPVYDFSGRNHVKLELWRFVEIEGSDDGNHYDLCYYQYKNDPGAEWLNFQVCGLNSEVDDDGWTKYSIDLSSVADGRSYFQLRFYCTTDDYLEGSGLCLDDIKLSWAVYSDFNADRKVDFADFAEFAAAFMTSPGDPGYDDAYDKIDKGIINLLDIAVFADDWLAADQMPDVPVEICDWQGCAAGAASISIDDSFYSCLDVLEDNDFNGTFYLSWTKDFYPYEWDYWQSVYDAGHEIGCHTNTHACAIQDEETLRDDLHSNIEDILTHLDMPAEELTSFAWPCGVNDANTKAIAAEYFVSARGYHINELENKNPTDFMNIKSLNTPLYHDPPLDPPDYFDMADEAENLGKWVNFVFHNHCEDDGAIDYLATKDLWVAPVGIVAKYIKERQNSRIENVVQTISEISFELENSLDPGLFNEKLTIKLSINPAYVQAVFVNGNPTVFESGAYDITFDADVNEPDGINNIRITKEVIPISSGCPDL